MRSCAAVHRSFMKCSAGDGGVDGAVFRRLQRLGFEFHHHARRSVDEQGYPAPRVRRVLARERCVRIRQRDREKWHADQEDEKRRVAKQREVRRTHHGQHRGQCHMRSSGFLPPQASCEQHHAGHGHEHDQHQDRHPRLIEVHVGGTQRQPLVECVADGVQQLPDRNHVQPISVADLVREPIIRMGHVWAVRSFFSAATPLSNAVSSADPSSVPLRP